MARRPALSTKGVGVSIQLIGVEAKLEFLKKMGKSARSVSRDLPEAVAKGLKSSIRRRIKTLGHDNSPFKGVITHNTPEPLINLLKLEKTTKKGGKGGGKWRVYMAEGTDLQGKPFNPSWVERGHKIKFWTNRGMIDTGQRTTPRWFFKNGVADFRNSDKLRSLIEKAKKKITNEKKGDRLGIHG